MGGSTVRRETNNFTPIDQEGKGTAMTDDPALEGNLSELRRRRAALDAEIRRQEADQDEEYNSQLDELYNAVLTFTNDQAIAVDQTERKNAVNVTLNGVITIEFGYERPDMGRRGYLTVRDSSSGMRAEFDGQTGRPSGLPTSAGLLGLIAGQMPHTALNSTGQ